MNDTLDRNALEMSRGVASRCWCDPETERKVLDTALAEAFAKRVHGFHEMLESAWGIIANANNGDWQGEKPEWMDAAMKWRDRYFAMLAANGDPK